MNIFEIGEMPTVIEHYHESCLRSYHILKFAKWMLQEGAPASVVLEIVEQLERHVAGTKTDDPSNHGCLVKP